QVLRSLGSGGLRSLPLDELARECSIGFGGCSTWSVLQNRFPKAWGFAQANTPRNHGLINAFAEMLAHLGYNLLTKICPTVVHGHDNTAELESRVRTRIAHLLDQSDNFYQSFQREILTLYWGQKFVGSRQCIGHQNSERWRTIQQNKIKRLICVQRLERFRQPREMIRHPGDFDLGTGKIEIGRHYKQGFAFRRKDSFANGGVTE